MNRLLARRLMQETNVYALLNGYRNRPPADMERLEEMIIRLSQFLIDFPEIAELELKTARMSGATLDAAALGLLLASNIERMAEELLGQPDDVALMEKLNKSAKLVQVLPFEVNLWKTQNICYNILHGCCPDFKKKADSGDENAQEWLYNAMVLSENFKIRMPERLL